MEIVELEKLFEAKLETIRVEIKHLNTRIDGMRNTILFGITIIVPIMTLVINAVLTKVVK